jgi:hypothetical protein
MYVKKKELNEHGNYLTCCVIYPVLRNEINAENGKIYMVRP